ncbi:MAG: heat-inducible transcription repressor HrcA [Clostridia bacterium]|nr:heat-inducible transcription repressor HrcA [Clostridia bacterium]
MNTAQRKDYVLGSVVELYIQTGEPVGSKAVSARLNDICSSATIRNDMCDLIERGYLIQPHTSAGRIPSANGYRYYIEKLMPASTLSNQARNQILDHLPRFRGDPETFIAETGKALAKITGCTAIATTPVAAKATLKRVEVLQMSGTSVLIAILTSSGLMKSKLCQLDLPITQQEIQLFVQVINERFADLPLSRITPAMAQTLAVSFGGHTLKYAPLLEQIFDAAQEAVRTNLHLEGQPNLLLYKEFSPSLVIELFARRESLLPFLNKSDGTAVYLGHELGDSALQNAALVVTDYSLKGDLKGKLAVLGPMKNDYRRLIPTVEFVAKATAGNLSLYI